MSDWTHPICEECWWKREYAARREAARLPVRMWEEYREEETCHFCGNRHGSGIYVREDPAVVPFPDLETS